MKKAVEKIIADLKDRSGLRQEWEQIDPLIQEEIKAEWANIIKANIQPQHIKVKFGFDIKLKDDVNKEYAKKYFSFYRDCPAIPRTGESVCFDMWIDQEILYVHYTFNEQAEVFAMLRTIVVYNRREYDEICRDAEAITKGEKR